MFAEESDVEKIITKKMKEKVWEIKFDFRELLRLSLLNDEKAIYSYYFLMNIYHFCSI